MKTNKLNNENSRFKYFINWYHYLFLINAVRRTLFVQTPGPVI